MIYNYYEEVKEDVLNYIKERYTDEEIAENLECKEDFAEKLHDDLWICDSVTGNASGSYTFNAYVAEEYIAHNIELLYEAVKEFGEDLNILQNGAEYCDVTIRCYVLSSAISDALDELEGEI